MNTYYVNLYDYFSIAAPEGAKGMLAIYSPHIPNAIPKSRMRPAVLILPGGGYYNVSDREGEPIALHFLAKGYCAFVLDYSCFPNRFPIALQEAAMALAYIRKNAEEFQIDPQMIAAIGFSAGGHLCGCLGTMYDCPEVTQLALPCSARPDALGLSYPVAISWGNTHEGSFKILAGEDEALRARLSLDKQVRRDMPPVYLWHTRDDKVVPVRNSLLLANALEENGIDFAMHIYRHGPHGLSTADEMAHPAGTVPEISWDVPGWLEAEIRFFNEIGLKIEDYEVEL